MADEGKGRQVLTIEANLDNLADVYAFLNNKLDQADVVPSARHHIDLAVEEIYTNIVKYAYPEEPGKATVIWHLQEPEGMLVLEFRDNGPAYNPWEKEDPDVTATVEDRAVGGLGVFMVKKMMDGVDYRYENGENVVMLMKNIRV